MKGAKIVLTCPWEVYPSEVIELSDGLREFLNSFLDGKYNTFRIDEEAFE